MSTMDLSHAETLIALADTGSVTAAAEALGVARPTIRRRVRALEERVGRRLVIISGSGAAMTDAGALYVEHARPLARDHQTLMELVAHGEEHLSGLVHAALPTGAPGPMTPEFLAMALELWPNVRVHLRSTEDPVLEIYRGAQVAFSLTLPTDDELVVSSVGHVRFGLFASAAYLRRHPAPTSPAELEHHTLWHASLGRLWPDHLPLCDGREHAITPRAKITDVSVVRAGVARGAAMGLLPEYMAEGLTQVLGREIGATRHVWCVTTRVGAELPTVRHLQRAVREFLRTKSSPEGSRTAASQAQSTT